jgi:hypothetical protein
LSRNQASNNTTAFLAIDKFEVRSEMLRADSALAAAVRRDNIGRIPNSSAKMHY